MHIALSELYCNEIRQELGLAPQPLTYAAPFKSSDAQSAAPPVRPLLSVEDFREQLRLASLVSALAPATEDSTSPPSDTAGPGDQRRGSQDGLQGSPATASS